MFIPNNAVSAASSNLLARAGESTYNLAQVRPYDLPAGANTTQVPAAYSDASKVQPQLTGSGHFVLYQDAYTADPPAVGDLQSEGYNVYAPAFWLSTSGPFDTLKQFCESANKQSVLDSYHNAGIKVVLTAFGSTDKPQDTYPNAADAANAIASYVKQCGLDGVDVDYEDLDRFNNGEGVSWLIDLTNSLRDQLPQGQYLLTHAPIGAWLVRDLYPKDGGYAALNQAVGSKIDWYNVQFYNQQNAWTTQDTLVNQANVFPGSAINQVVANQGFSASQIVVGKSASTQDSPQGGYVAPSDLGSWLKTTNNFAGISVWQAPHEAQFLSTARAAGGF